MINYSSIVFALLLCSCFPMGWAQDSQSQDASPVEATAVQRQEIERICNFAATVDLSKPKDSHRDYDDKGKRAPIPERAEKAIKALTGLIARMPRCPEMARAYLLLGNLKNRFMDSYKSPGYVIEEGPIAPPEIKNILWEYEHHESANEFMYNGWHYKELIELYPESAYADDAAYALAGLGPFGEIENDQGMMSYILYSMTGFIEKYPNSPLVNSAVDRITTAFASVTNLDYRVEEDMWYYPDSYRACVKEYEKAAANIPLPVKARAYYTISEAWMKLGDFGKARELCEFVIKNVPGYPRIGEIKERLAKLSRINFTLNPIDPTDYSAKLSWDRPDNDKVTSYSIYRSTSPDQLGLIVGSSTSPATLEYTDVGLNRGDTFWYTVNAVGPGVSLYSNQTGISIRKRREAIDLSH